MQLDRDGAQLFPAAFGPDAVAAIAALFPACARSARLGPMPDLPPLLGPADTVAKAVLGPLARPVRALFFDKNPERNWSLGWHQDRTVALRERRDTAGFTAWTVKSGIHHAVPPQPILERMLTLRIHLDDVDEDNSPLLVSPGSQRLGRIAEPEIPAAVARLGVVPCLAAAGDLWAYRSLILHASERARRPARRRVLQLSYSPDRLPGGLDWLGV
jgi:hypothetical protein